MTNKLKLKLEVWGTLYFFWLLWWAGGPLEKTSVPIYINDFFIWTIYSVNIAFVIMKQFLFRKVAVPLANDPTLSGRSIWLLRHLEHQNPSIISERGFCKKK